MILTYQPGQLALVSASNSLPDLTVQDNPLRRVFYLLPNRYKSSCKILHYIGQLGDGLKLKDDNSARGKNHFGVFLLTLSIKITFGLDIFSKMLLVL